MLAIAESGSTKTEWVLLNNENEVFKRIKTIGFNPDFHSQEDVLNELNSHAKEFIDPKLISRLYFYGAGCSSDRLRKVIHSGLSEFFTEANISVDHDLAAAAYSLYQDRPIVACILGTGSNSCFFDGKEIHEKVPALGFLLGDEGGGGYFGKQLLRAYFYRLLPDFIADDFYSTYQINWEDARKRLYKSDDANVYAASFTPFLAKHSEDPFIHKILEDGFQQFVDVNVKCFDLPAGTTVNFVGSVSYYFRDQIATLLERNGLQLGKVIKSPIDELVQFHCRSAYAINSSTNGSA